MGNTIKGVIATIFGVIIVASLFGVVTNSVNDMKFVETTQAIASVGTEVGVTTATITLDQEVYENTAANVLSVTSSNASDTQITVTAVNGKQVTVSGLAASGTRTLTVKYKYDALTGFTGLSAIVVLIPTMIIIAFIYALIKKFFD